MQGKLYRYNLIKTLAKKYSHTTYLASPINKPEQQVIVVIFPSSLFASPPEQELLLQKAQQIKDLQHPHLLPILDMGREDGRPFVVRDYLPSESLRSRLKRLSPQLLEISDALLMVLQIGKALAHAHQQAIFHGNLKPENILFDANGKVLLTDFDLVNKVDAMVRDKTSEEYAFCYTAPEQFAGACNAYSDQYALGFLTYELLTGQVPFATQTLASLMGDFHQAEPIPLSEKKANLPSSLNTAVLKSLAKQPNERFSDLTLFLEAIQAVLSPPSPAFPLVRAPSIQKLDHASPEAHPLQAVLTVSAASEISYDLAEILADPVSSAPERTEYSAPFQDALLLQPFQEQEKTQDNNYEHMDETMTALPDVAYQDLSPQSAKQYRRRNSVWLLPLSCIVLLISLIAWSKPTALLSLEAGTLATLMQQNPTQVSSQPLAPISAASSSAQLTGQSTLSRQRTASTGKPSQASPSVTSTLQATVSGNASPSATSTLQATVSSKTTPTSPMVIPTPTPTPYALQTTTVDDSVMGTGLNQFNYVGSGWQHSLSVCPGSECHGTLPYNGSHSWDSKVNDYVIISFTGIQIKLYGIIDVRHGIGAVSIDGGTETIVDFYGTTLEGNQLLWTSPMLPAGTHTFKLRVTGNKNPNSSGTTIEPDRVDIVS